MQRRSFIKNAAFSAVAVSASGFIRFDGKKKIGNCETTTDLQMMQAIMFSIPFYLWLITMAADHIARRIFI